MPPTRPGGHLPSHSAVRQQVTKSSGKADLATFFPDRVHQRHRDVPDSLSSSASSHSNANSVVSSRSSPVTEKSRSSPAAKEKEKERDGDRPVSVLQLGGKSYQIEYDPELDKTKSRGKHAIYRAKHKSTPIDPRNLVRDYPVGARPRRKIRMTSLGVLRYAFDANSVGPKPPSQILVSGFSRLATDSAVALQFKEYGELEKFSMQKDPVTGSSLGMCLIKFRSDKKQDILQAHHAAKLAVKAAKAGTIKVGFDSVTVEYDDDGKICASRIEEQVRLSQAAQPQPLTQPAKSRSPSPRARSPPRRRRSLSRSPSRTPPRYDSDSRSYRAPPPPPQTDLFTIIGKRPYIFISDRYVPVSRVYSADIEDYLRDYDYVTVYVVKRDLPPKLEAPHRYHPRQRELAGFYVVFESLSEAKACFRHMDGRVMDRLRWRVNMSLQLPYDQDRSVEVRGRTEEKREVARPKVASDPIKDAIGMILKELQEGLRKDIKERITVPTIYDLLDPSKFQNVKSEVKTERKVAMADTVEQLGKLPLLPRFKKRNATKKEAPTAVSASPRSRPMNHQLNDYVSDEEEIHEDETHVEDEVKEKKTKVRQPRIKVDYSDSETEVAGADDDEPADVEMKDEPVSKKRKRPTKKTERRKKKLVRADFTTSEEDEATPATTVSPMDVDKKVEQLPTPSDEADFNLFDQTDNSYWAPSAVLIDEPLDSDKVFDLDGVQALVADVEDFKYLQLALEHVEPDDIGNPMFWAWLHRRAKFNFHNGMRRGATRKLVRPDDEYERVNQSGSARTEGYYRIPESDKTEYLEHRKRLRKKKHDADAVPDAESGRAGSPDDVADDSAAPLLAADTGTEKDNTSSRLNRINNRRLAADINLQKQMLSTDNDVLRFNQLKKRKKPVRFARSAIHNWGLYAMENIAANDMIIEYVGEVVRQPVADMRERRYLKNGIGSSYLFRIDESTVVDATKRGGIARFINHCCTPSCTAKIIKVEGQKRIVIYALKDVAANEELTYDYKFEREVNSDERIPCLCGSSGCKGFLN